MVDVFSTLKIGDKWNTKAGCPCVVLVKSQEYVKVQKTICGKEKSFTYDKRFINDQFRRKNYLMESVNKSSQPAVSTMAEKETKRFEIGSLVYYAEFNKSQIIIHPVRIGSYRVYRDKTCYYAEGNNSTEYAENILSNSEHHAIEKLKSYCKSQKIPWFE